MKVMDERHWLFWDGNCGFCRKAVIWFRRQDTAQRFQIIPYQEGPTPPMTPLLYEQAARAIQVITIDGRHLKGGRAALFCLAEVGWHPRLVRIAQRRPLVWFVELGYWFVARYRRKLSRFLPEQEPPPS
jgi:predicted DCC family thiol-disulfide oxidoreductase YuxK